MLKKGKEKEHATLCARTSDFGSPIFCAAEALSSKSWAREGWYDKVKNVKKAAFAFLLAFAVLVLASGVNTEPAPAWGPDTQLTTDMASDLHPSGGEIMQDTTGTIWFVWASNRIGNYDIWYKSSSDGGATWTADTRLTTHTAIDDTPSITQTSDGRIWVVFHSWRSANPDLYYMTSPDGGATWSSGTQLTTDSHFDLNPSIVQLSDGTIFVAWQSDRIRVKDPDTGQMIPQDDVYYKTSSDGGATWTADTRLTMDPNDDADPSVTQTTDDKIWIAFWSSRLDPRDIYYTTSSDGGATWTAETRLTTYSGDDWAPSITQTADGKIWVMFHSQRAGNWDIYYKTTSNGGVDWTPDTRLTDHPDVDVGPSITQTAGGKMWAAFASRRMGNYDIWYKIKIWGDVNGDGTVDIFDALWIAGTFGSTPGDPNWNPECDLYCDEVIDLYDALVVAGNFGESI